MSSPADFAPSGHGPARRRRRLFGTWWRQQSVVQQDRFATLAPLAAVLLFLAAMMSAFWYLRHEELEHAEESLRREGEAAQQQIRLRLIDNQEQLVRIARELGITHDEREFLAQASGFMRERPEVARLLRLRPDGSRRAEATAEAAAAGSAPGSPAFRADPWTGPSARAPAPEAAAAFASAHEWRQPVYSLPLTDADGRPIFQLHVPEIQRGAFAGMLVAEYSIEALLRQIPPQPQKRRGLSIVDERGNVLAGAAAPSRPARRGTIVHELPLAPVTNGLLLRVQGSRSTADLLGNTLYWMVLALSGLTVWTLLGTLRHVRRRAQIQTALVQETNFRRAMENSMLTGMRAMDSEGRVTYVNPAFCAMTGFTEEELIGRLPPYPYWPPDRYEENTRLLMQEVRGRSPAGGIEVKVMRKDGTIFDARMYVSPLIDARGQQTGWMTSMTNITEAKRVRDQLSASHERFTTVLEGLDAAVSVLSAQEGELLFANRSYRLWFGADAAGHALLAGSEPAQPMPVADEPLEPFGEPADVAARPREVFVESLQKWFDCRARYLQWTDGRRAQMLIATDITARVRAEALADQQAEKAQVTSRLITMGEMASSVAHELNQPLTAIANYCNGMVSRLKAGKFEHGELIEALHKTARQAQRAGQIIHRIRAFVKKSEPQRVRAEARAIVDDAVELAGIELRRRNVSIHTYVAQRLPALRVDPILIEQVLLNLLRNSAEAIDQAALPPSRRYIELRVVPRHTPDEGSVIEFSVTDSGPGLKDEVIARLYEAFFSTKAEGLGIGLSLCRSIIESHRGRIRAQNLYNGPAIAGCRFTFTLPVDDAGGDQPIEPLQTSTMP